MKRSASQRYDGGVVCITFLSISGRSRSQRRHVRIDGERASAAWGLESGLGCEPAYDEAALSRGEPM